MPNLAGHGPNVGYGYTKYIIIDSSGTELPPIVFPSTIARATGAAAGSLGKVASTKIGQARYWTGYDAQLSAAQITMLGQDRIADPIFIPALLSGALSRFGHLNGSSRGVCVSGLPASWCELTREIDGVSVRNALEVQLGKALRAGAPADAFARMQIIAEPLGLAYSVLLDNDGRMAADPALATGRIGCVDLGHKTDDTAELLRLTVVKSSLASYDDLGTVRPLAEIRSRLSAHFDRSLSILETDQAVRNGYVTVAGKQQPLPRHWDRPLIENGQAKAARLSEAWGSGNQFETILIGGGGAELEQLTAPTLATFRHAIVVDRPQTAIPRGYAKLARRLAASVR